MYYREDEELVINLKRNYQNQSTEELLDIWSKNDRYNYRDEAFSAIREILISRNIEVPEQKAVLITKQTKRKPEEKKEIIRGAACVIAGVLTTILWYLSDSNYVLVPTGLIVYGSYILIKHQAIK